jgi:hypothetical protein
MYYLVVDPVSEKELIEALGRAGVSPTIYHFPGSPMLRCPNRSKVHGKKKILEFAEKLHSEYKHQARAG